MTAKTLRHGLSRAGFWLPVAAGVGVLAAGISLWASIILVGAGVLNFVRVVAKPGLHQELERLEEKRRRGIKRRLKNAERLQLEAIDAYCTLLRENALEPELADETWDRAWAIVRDASGQDGSKALLKFRNSLPELEASKENVIGKIEKDLERRRKIDRELDAL